MSTLADMKARIVTETMREDLGGSDGTVDLITSEIISAIRYYQAKRFYFSEKQTTVTLSTVDGQSVYGPPPAKLVQDIALASAYLPGIVRIDSLSTLEGDWLRDIRLTSEERIKQMTASPSSKGSPRWYSYYGQYLTLYPVPDATYTVLISGVVKPAAPLTPIEEGNVWMNEAEELIRFRAKSRLYANSMLDPQMAQAMAAMESEVFDALQQESSARTQVDRIIPSECI